MTQDKPQIGTFVIVGRPPTTQPWNQYCLVGMVEQPDENPATWNGQNSEAFYLNATGRIKVRVIDHNGAPQMQPSHHPISDTSPTTRGRSFKVESLADALACWPDKDRVYEAIFALAAIAATDRHLYWRGEIAKAVQLMPRRYNPVNGGDFLGYYDEGYLAIPHQYDVWRVGDQLSLMRDDNFRTNHALRDTNRVAAAVWSRHHVWTKLHASK